MTGLRIRRSALEHARRFFEQQGARGLEGTAMLVGTPAAGITRCVIPDQIGRRSPLGASVEVTLKGKLELATALVRDERYLARIHSHPRKAFHSRTDDENPGLTAQGALSIVVPDFGRGLRDGLAACAIFERSGTHWVELSAAEIRERLVVVG